MGEADRSWQKTSGPFMLPVEDKVFTITVLKFYRLSMVGGHRTTRRRIAMNGWRMVVIHDILNINLPIASNLVFLAPLLYQVVQAITIVAVRQIAQLLQ